MTKKISDSQIVQTTPANSIQFFFKDFILSRKAASLSPYTIRFYNNTLPKFIEWLTERSVTTPAQITSQLIRLYISERSNIGLSVFTIHGYARSIKAFLNFLRSEEVIPTVPHIDMPKLKKKRQPILDQNTTLAVIQSCSIRDRAIILFFIDSGMRLSELLNIAIDNVNINTGLVRVINGKGGKDRSVAIGNTTIRAVMQYQQTDGYVSTGSFPLFQTVSGQPISRWGMVQIFKRISKRIGIHVTPHALRRTFAILSLRAGMNPMAVQDLMGHTDMTMTKHYAQMIDDDLLNEHRLHSPIDSLKLKLKRN